MSDLAPAGELKSLPYPLMMRALARLEADLGPEGVAALRYHPDFWLRPAQRVTDLDNLATIEVFVGERRAGKTMAACRLFTDLVRTRRILLPRIVSATDAAIVDVALEGASGIKAWLPRAPDAKDPPLDVYEFKKSDGFAGTLHLYGTKVVCCSAAAPGQGIGMSRDGTLAEDPAGWIESVGESIAADTWTEILKSNSEGISCVIVPTTPAGAEFISDLLDPAQRNDPRFIRIHDLGAVENNRANLAPNYLAHIVSDLRKKAKWNEVGGVSPFRDTNFHRMRLTECPRLVKLAVAIDPSRSVGAKACEVGIVGGGLDARDIVHARTDASAVLDDGQNGWPARAWDVAEQLQAAHPGAPVHFILETNTGSGKAELLRAEERARRKARGLPGNNVAEVVLVKASKNKCERAKLPAMVAAQGQVMLADNMRECEGQLRQLTPEGKKSDRADAFVHLVRDLGGLSDEKEIAKMASAEEKATAAAAQCLEVEAINAAMRVARHGAPPGEGEVMKVEGAPPGDARYAGPSRFVARPQTWRTRGVL